MIFLLCFLEESVDNGCEMNVRHVAVELVRQLFVDSLDISVPPGAIQVETIDVNAILWFLGEVHIAFVFINGVEVEHKRVDGYFVLAGVVLFGAGEEGLGEEEPTDPEGTRGSFINPLLDEGQSFNEVNQVAG
jgi:hypothetical protein